jgi:hypothetical protein
VIETDLLSVEKTRQIERVVNAQRESAVGPSSETDYRQAADVVKFVQLPIA